MRNWKGGTELIQQLCLFIAEMTQPNAQHGARVTGISLLSESGRAIPLSISKDDLQSLMKRFLVLFVPLSLLVAGVAFHFAAFRPRSSPVDAPPVQLEGAGMAETSTPSPEHPTPLALPAAASFKAPAATAPSNGTPRPAPQAPALVSSPILLPAKPAFANTTEIYGSILQRIEANRARP